MYLGFQAWGRAGGVGNTKAGKGAKDHGIVDRVPLRRGLEAATLEDMARRLAIGDG